MTTHWMVVSELLKSIASRSIATLITVVSRIDMIAPSRTTPATIQVERSRTSSSVAGWDTKSGKASTLGERPLPSGTSITRSGTAAAWEDREVAEIATIGVYGFDERSFLGALSDAGVDLVLDVRQRRGVRGSEYAWANARRLEASLRKAGVGYEHHRELAPTTEMREVLRRADAKRGERQRTRTRLDPEFVRRYNEEILAGADLDAIAAAAETGLPALLCVELDPRACHRSLIAARLEERGLRARHLGPAGGDGR